MPKPPAELKLMLNVCSGNTPRLCHAVIDFAWVAAPLLMFLGGYIILYQLIICLPYLLKRSTKNGSYSHSILIGPLFFTAGAWLLPDHLLRHYAWIAWPLDPGTWVLVFGLPTLTRALRDIYRDRKKPIR